MLWTVNRSPGGPATNRTTSPSSCNARTCVSRSRRCRSTAEPRTGRPGMVGASRSPAVWVETFTGHSSGQGEEALRLAGARVGGNGARLMDGDGGAGETGALEGSGQPAGESGPVQRPLGDDGHPDAGRGLAHLVLDDLGGGDQGAAQDQRVHGDAGPAQDVVRPSLDGDPQVP